MLKQYINNVQEALRKEKHVKADEAWIDSDWKAEKENINIGYKAKTKMAKEEKYHKKEVKKPKKK